MDLAFSKDELAFRDEVRRFIAENFDEDLRAQDGAIEERLSRQGRSAEMAERAL